jgi:L-erythro-3,5-diaminohexanoate dehydrogenase
VRGDSYGTHRVLEPRGALPQAAWRLDNDIDALRDDEVAIEVETLNVDSASFRQMEEAHRESEAPAAAVARQIVATVAERGKQHNPVTGSGGMLVGRVSAVGPASKSGLSEGERIATLCSLTLTPLRLRRVVAVHLATHQVDVEAGAILFGSSPFARLPEGPGALDRKVALAALDVAGAAPQTARLVAPGRRVLVLGCGGKSGLLCGAAARRAGAGQIIGVESVAVAAATARRLGAFDRVLELDATRPVEVAAAVVEAGGLADLTISCVNVADAEMSAVLSTRDRGTVYFFSMSTSFTKAALGAEGVSRDVTLVIGNGYCHGHAEATLRLLEQDRPLRAIFEERFGPRPT